MTIIATDGKRMVADSWCFQSSVGYPMPTPKIIRMPDGGIVGAGGYRGDADAIRQWAAQGMPDEKPMLIKSEEDAWLWLKPDGTVWYGDCLWMLSCYQVVPPFSIGNQDACLMIEGALLCGVDLIKAAKMVAQRCSQVNGDLTVLDLEDRE